MDIAAGTLFGEDKRSAPGLAGQLSRYFEHGLSTERRWRHALAGREANSERMMNAGWIQPDLWESLPAKRTPNQKHLLAVYGNSFARQIAETASSVDSDVGVRMVFGPVAPPSHSYACFLADRGLHEADTVVLGVVSSTLPGLRSMTRATQSVQEPFPYTYPRYRLIAGNLEPIQPMIRNLDDLAAALENPELWDRYAEQLAEWDEFYTAALFNESVFDRSAFAKLLRTAWAIRRQRIVEESVRGIRGAHDDTDSAAVLRAILRDFDREARAAGMHPLVLALSTQAQGNDLDELLREDLRTSGIPAIFSNDLCPASDLASYQADGHFSPNCARKIAQAMLARVRSP